MTAWTETAQTLLDTARREGILRKEAACWLLAECGAGRSKWPDALQEAGYITWTHQEEEDWDLADVQWERLAGDLARSDPLYGTGAELCVLRFACSLVTGTGGPWGDDLPRLDHTNRRLVLGAIAWASGGASAASGYILDEPQTGHTPSFRVL